MTTELRDQLQHTLGKAYTIERELGTLWPLEENTMALVGREPAFDILRHHPRFQRIAALVQPANVVT